MILLQFLKYQLSIKSFIGFLIKSKKKKSKLKAAYKLKKAIKCAKIKKLAYSKC